MDFWNLFSNIIINVWLKNSYFVDVTINNVFKWCSLLSKHITTVSFSVVINIIKYSHILFFTILEKTKHYMSRENPKDGWNLNDSFSEICYFLQEILTKYLSFAQREILIVSESSTKQRPAQALKSRSAITWCVHFFSN